jgi:hypothetical protein
MAACSPHICTNDVRKRREPPRRIARSLIGATFSTRKSPNHYPAGRPFALETFNVVVRANDVGHVAANGR